MGCIWLLKTGFPFGNKICRSIKKKVKEVKFYDGVNTIRKERSKKPLRELVEVIVLTIILELGIDNFGRMLRDEYYNLIGDWQIDAGIYHCFEYLGQVCFIVGLVIYALAVKKDRKYFTPAFKKKAVHNLLFLLLGAAIGFVMMFVCVGAAVLNGTLEVNPLGNMTFPVLLFGIFAVFVQSSTEEFECRAFVFGKMYGEGVSAIGAAVISSLFFSLLHFSNDGFGILPMIDLALAGGVFVAAYYVTGNIWFVCSMHMMWNFTQDFVFGLPNSGHPVATSVFRTTVKGSGFFYNPSFGIEGTGMSIIVNLVVIMILLVVGKLWKKPV